MMQGAGATRSRVLTLVDYGRAVWRNDISRTIRDDKADHERRSRGG